MKAQPPKRALKFLRWFCREDYLEEIEGDLIEIFELQFLESPSKAKRLFIWRVLMSFRPMFFKSIIKVNSNQTTMFKNHIKVSWRSLRRQPFFTMLNTFGLAIGMSGAILIGLFIHDEISFDLMFDDSDRIYRVNIDNKTAGEVNKYAAVSGPLAESMKKDFPHMELVTRFRNTDSKLIRSLSAEQNIKEEHVVGADPNFFKMFGLELLLGDESKALSEQYSMVMTRTAAEKHFGLSDALGQQVLVDNDQTYLVTGVVDDFPKNSFLRDHTVLLSISSFDDVNSPAWNNWNFPTFVKLNPDAEPAQLDAYLGTVLERYLIPWASQFIPGLTVESSRKQMEESGDYMNFESIPLTDIHLKSANLSGEFSANGQKQDVYILGIIGVFLLTLASVNFMNLSTAQSLRRAKEVGIRKTLGSERSSLIFQFLTEATLVSFLSLSLAITFVLLILPYFNTLADKAIVFPYANPVFWFAVLGATLLLGLISGCYPSFVMSRFSLLKSLKGQFEKGRNGSKIRSVLVVFQFAISVFLIACTLIVFDQLSFIQNKDLGYSKDQILVINNIQTVGDQSKIFKQEVEKLASVEATSLSSYLPTPSDRSGTTFFPKGNVFNPEAAVIINKWGIDFDYLELLDIELVSGRLFQTDFPTDSTAIILNESAVKMLGSNNDEIIGMQVTDDFRKDTEDEMNFYTVIGVVRNFHYETLKNDVDGLSFFISEGSNRMMVKLNNTNYKQSLDKIESLWSELAPSAPFDFYFMDDSFNEVYKAEEKLSKIFIVFTSLSIVVACLGLFGLSAYNAERRSKEIGIRKVLGASLSQITFSLTSEFLKLVIIAVICSIPFAWLAMNKWLQGFSFRIDISAEVFVVAALIAIVISVITVGYQGLSTATKNPVNSLRSE